MRDKNEYIMLLEYNILKTLKIGAKRLRKDDREALIKYVRSQMTTDGCFVNRAGKKDLYYTMFGWIIYYVMGIENDERMRADYLKGVDLEGLDNLHRSVYRQCLIIDSLLSKGLMRTAIRSLWTRDNLKDFFRQFVSHTRGITLNSEAAKILIDKNNSPSSFEYIISMQDETGGFRANEGAAIPDMLSTAVALFILNMKGISSRYDAKDFIEVHINDEGAFMPNLLDDTSDVEYVFYGLLAMGSL